MRCNDLDRVSGLDDFEADRAAVTSLPGKIEERSYGNPESRSDVTDNQPHKLPCIVVTYNQERLQETSITSFQRLVGFSSTEYRYR